MEMNPATSIDPPASQQILTENDSDVITVKSTEYKTLASTVLELAGKVHAYEDEIVSLKSSLNSVEGALARANEAKDVQQAGYEERIDDLGFRFYVMAKKIEKAQQEQLKTRADLKEYEDDMNKYQQQLMETIVARDKLQGQIDRLMAAIEPICITNRAEIQDPVDHCIENLGRFFHNSEELQVLNDDLEVQLKEHQELVKTASRTTEHTTSLMEQTEKKLQMAQNTEQELKSTIEALEQRNQALTEHQKEYEMRVANAIIALVSQINELTPIKEDRARLLIETNELRKELLDARTEINEFKIKNFTLTQDLREYKELLDVVIGKIKPVKLLPGKLKKCSSRSRIVKEDPERTLTEEELENIPDRTTNQSQETEKERRNTEKEEEIETLKNQVHSVEKKMEEFNNIRDDMFNELRKAMLKNEEFQESSKAESHQLQQKIAELEEKLKNNGFHIEFPESDKEAEVGDDDDNDVQEVHNIYLKYPESSNFEDENGVEQTPQVVDEEHEDWDLVN